MASWSTVTRSGLVVIDKPAGLTSHDVVARVRRIAGTRKVGHGGTLDPMATGVLVVGVERATRLLTYVVGCDKRYTARIRLGQSTVTDDAEGEVVATADASRLTGATLPDASIQSGLMAMVGEIDQVPSAVSAIKVKGVRSYARVRGGEQVELAARRVTVHHLAVIRIIRVTGAIDVEIDVRCSSGTYVRAIARDLGAALGVGGHLTALRRESVGSFTAGEALTIEALAGLTEPVPLSMAEAAGRLLPGRVVTADEARVLGHGGSLAPQGMPGPYAVFGPGGEVIAVVVERAGRARPETVLTPA
ncbi:MAG: tRNA pseudouridine(55) synthase TruB [Micromonosporaceae bacterium]|nr:tRNA pseudouridine(55) synthase TruB [Micromonosporaceae bacterium]